VRAPHTVRNCSCRIDSAGSGGFDASALLMAAALFGFRRKEHRKALARLLYRM
jgi:hypothetical protein